MYAGELKGFTFNDCSLECNKSGIYLIHYSVGVTLSANVTISAYITGEYAVSFYYATSIAAGVTGDTLWLSKTVLMSLEEDDSVGLYIKSSVATSVLVYDASVTLHRIGDN
jgi:hypothetical protein